MDEIAPMVVAIGVLLIPITAILTTHQRKMAAMIHGQPESESVFRPRNDSNELVQEIRQLRAEVAALSIAVDDARNETRSLRQRASGEPPVLRH
ncbi:MAG TPA: hypothetical protein VK171_10080 [Fimbriimonas sp.]|nr:hypothetical protein [Fimbriimonas sp.]